MDTNHFIVKTFETFQAENKEYYPKVIHYLTTINEGLEKTRQVGNWLVEGEVNYDNTDTGYEDSSVKENEIVCKNETEGLDIYINWTFIVTQGRVTPDTDTTPGTTDYNTEVNIDEVVFYTESGSYQFQIVVDANLSQLCISILDKLNK